MNLWEANSELDVTYSASIGDAYAVAARNRDNDDVRNSILLVGVDDDYDVVEDEKCFSTSLSGSETRLFTMRVSETTLSLTL